MRKIYIKHILAASALLLAFSSCDLERLPKSAMAADESLVSANDVTYWENGFYVGLRATQRGIFSLLQDIQADQLHPGLDYGNRMGQPYTWTSFTADNYELRDIWVAYYNRIKNICYTINKVKDMEVAQGDQAVVNRGIGLAYFLRAYYYSNLAIRYGRPYVASSAATDLCVPLVLEYAPTAMPARATNKEIYDQILSDLNQAESLLANVAPNADRDEISIDAVAALKARVYLYMSDWANAYASATKVINTGNYPLVKPVAESFENMWHHSNSTEEILQLYIKRVDEEPNTLGVYYAPSTSAKRYPGVEGNDETNANKPDWIPTQEVLDLYEDGDLRKPVYFEKQICNLSDMGFEIYIISKFKGDIEYAVRTNAAWTYWNGYIPNGLSKPKVFRVAEQYLIAAEAAYRNNDAANATKYLNELRASRGLAAVTASGDQLFEEIKNERTRELAFEGFRLWDLRRWNLPMKRGAAQQYNGASDFIAENPGVKLTIEAGNNKFVWGIPQNDIKTNPNIANQQNPGWGI